jgi:hypothetical protein
VRRSIKSACSCAKLQEGGGGLRFKVHGGVVSPVSASSEDREGSKGGFGHLYMWSAEFLISSTSYENYLSHCPIRYDSRGTYQTLNEEIK